MIRALVFDLAGVLLDFSGELARVRGPVPLACLSNTNVLDVARFRRELCLDERFDYCFFYNEISLRKPGADCYRYVVERLAVPAGDIAFFDDSTVCVEGAARCGMQAYECAGVEMLGRQLATLGYPS